MIFKDKINKKDVGYAEDSFELMKQAVGKESHHLADFISSRDKIDLDKFNSSREVRTEIQNSILKFFKVELKGQAWCEFKHLCGIAMHTHELLSRASNNGLMDVANEMADVHKKLYLEYLSMLGINEKNISFGSSA